MIATPLTKSVISQTGPRSAVAFHTRSGPDERISAQDIRILPMQKFDCGPGRAQIGNPKSGMKYTAWLAPDQAVGICSDSNPGLVGLIWPWPGPLFHHHSRPCLAISARVSERILLFLACLLFLGLFSSFTSAIYIYNFYYLYRRENAVRFSLCSTYICVHSKSTHFKLALDTFCLARIKFIWVKLVHPPVYLLDSALDSYLSTAFIRSHLFSLSVCIFMNSTT